MKFAAASDRRNSIIDTCSAGMEPFFCWFDHCSKLSILSIPMPVSLKPDFVRGFNISKARPCIGAIFVAMQTAFTRMP